MNALVSIVCSVTTTRSAGRRLLGKSMVRVSYILGLINEVENYVGPTLTYCAAVRLTSDLLG